MLHTVKKALWVVRTRPMSFCQHLRGYWLFRQTRLFAPLLHNPAKGISLGRNARVQSLRALSAEKPLASVSIGDDCIIYENNRLSAWAEGIITIGASSVLGETRIECRASVRLGQRVLTSWNVFIQDFDPHPTDPILRGQQVRQICENFRPSYRPPQSVPPLDWQFPTAPITIGDDVWIGANVTIMKGARIGNGCIVATGSVVLAGDYPDHSMIGGVPAKVLKAAP